MGVNMKLLLVCCLTLLAASPTLSKCLGSINVREYGEVFIVAPDWSAGNIDIHDNGFTLRGNSRLYFASSCEDGWNNGMYAQMNLNGKRFAYTLDMSNVGCHCNAAAYFVDMPGNNGGENWDYCDGGGCQANAFNVNSGMMCPGGCTINTDQSFTVSHFQTSSVANTWMGQGAQSADFNMCNDGGYVSNMAGSYDSMVFTASLWGGGGIDMNWLDGMTGCGGECNIDGSSVTMTNFELYAPP